MKFEQQLFEIKAVSKKGADYARFEIGPLNHGYGHTLGVALRRVLLSSLPGAAITEVKIAGVRHQFSTLKGMDKDIVSFVLGLKKVRLSFSGEKPEKITLSVKGPKTVLASDMKMPATVKLANPDLVLANLSKGAKLEAEILVESGFGYLSVEEREVEQIGTIPVDAIFSPILRVNYEIEETRVGRLTNYDKLIPI